MTLAIRAAAPGDAALLLYFIEALAEYEKLRHEAVATEADLDAALFGPRPYAEAVIAEWGGIPVGFALYFFTFSTFNGRPSLYLEDLFVLPEHRGRGIGRRLLSHLAGIAVDRNCGRFEWSVLDWNAPSIRFYESLGARRMAEWLIYRLTGDALSTLASERRNGETGDGQ
ncbi:GNAT family N-acetyltransferase [Iodidimonas sp. SYSU 1G8]|uniref:GNAT family N-acetyltransferase n=1 Tax=Iodidimonas sp. SYSU 1G8 TaxID=3133967 RepID=UPI0031FF0FCA